MNKIIRWYNIKNYSTDGLLDRLLNLCIESGVVDYHMNENRVCEGYCKFFNGVEYRFWYRNIPYTWLSEGVFDKDGTMIYFYKDVMPRKRTMNRFHNAICEYIEKKITR